MNLYKAQVNGAVMGHSVSSFEHVRQSRTLANKFIINKLIEQTRKLSANMTKSKSARRSCEMEKENFG